MKFKNEIKQWYEMVSNTCGSFLFYEKFGFKFLYKYLRMRYLLTNKLTMPFLEYRVTTKCTLQCRECNHLMPYYSEEAHVKPVSFSDFKQDIDKFLKGVDLIYYFQFVGGETLLVKDLPEMIEYASGKNQLQHIVVITNGTLLPSKKLISAMKKVKRLHVTISNYKGNKDLAEKLKTDELTKILKENNIRYFLHPEDTVWTKSQVLTETYKKDPDIAKENYNRCGLKTCHNICCGKFHLCSMSVFLQRNKPDFEFEQDEIIEIRNGNTLSKNLFRFFDKSYYNFCSHCDFSRTNEFIMPAQQL
ncbi:MAG: hypothetical protein LBK53_03600 [Heliobacteriaceae bacterium]|nr:hypothetical protein [Heliobacteriaceae bacterium]